MQKLKIGQILTTKELVEIWGTEKQKNNYYKTKKLKADTKNSILKEAGCYCKLESFKVGRELRYKIVEVYESKLDKIGGKKYPEVFAQCNCSGVYILKDINNRFYIGSSVNVYGRYVDHKHGDLSRSRMLDKETMSVYLIEETRGLEDEVTLRYWEQQVMNWCISKGFDVVNRKASFKSKF